MTEKEFLKSTLRQLLILGDHHKSYFKRNLLEVVNLVFGEKEDEDETVYAESLSDMF
ncbi:hypothetical protein [Clostridium sp. YIM B02551]|uniref:hypothetical protein n=1 Tax=Clostridium sp. YIM B02551 TaxID=2910679 RepID=UPI001EEB8D22|nr:hypothetical protein [Clostridium sp. YIM B02551]